MKKLLATAAVCGLVVASAPAYAGIDLDIGGYMKGYLGFTDQDNDTAVAGEARELDIIRNTEIHFTGETTLDNGLTVGLHAEIEADGNNQETTTFEESYAYFSSAWGRVNFGAEDGASYLLQVAAPSADSNVDGIRQLINPVNYTATAGTGLAIAGGYDYEQNLTGYDDKITYLSPIVNGFQLGLSYTPDVDDASDSAAENEDDVNNALGSAYETSVRYEGSFENVGFTVGAGYTLIELENDTDAINNEDDRQAWNVGLDLDIGPFGIGAAYTEDNFADNVSNSTDDEEETYVVGVDYTTGPFKLGASYLNQDNSGDVAGSTGAGIETERYTGGVVYTYGPGMTFRGSVSYIEHSNVAGLTTGTSVEATSVLLGTNIKF